MALAHSPKIATDGLVFAYDMGNAQKSWKGAPATNLITNPTNEVIATGAEFAVFQDISPIFDANGPGIYSISADIKSAIPGNVTVYTASGDVEYNIGYFIAATSTLYKRFYFNNISVTQTNPAINFSNLSFYGVYGTGVFPSIKNVQVEKNSFCTPFVNGTRSNTQAVVDLTGTNVLTASNLTYNVDGTFSFNNTSSVITIPDNPVLNPTTALTIEAWVKFNGDSDDFIFEKGDVNSQYSLFSHSSDIAFRTFHSVDGTFHTQNPAKTSIGVVNGVPVHITCTWDGFTKRIYINGVLKDSVAKTGVLITRTTGAAIGRFGGTTTGYYFGGDIYKVAVYNRALSATEVQQNFNSLRTRYGV